MLPETSIWRTTSWGTRTCRGSPDPARETVTVATSLYGGPAPETYTLVGSTVRESSRCGRSPTVKVARVLRTPMLASRTTSPPSPLDGSRGIATSATNGTLTSRGTRPRSGTASGSLAESWSGVPFGHVTATDQPAAVDGAMF